MLAERVQQLGGVPLFDFNDIAQQSLEAGVSPQQGGTLADMVIQDLMIEREQVDAYTRLVREIADTDMVTRTVLLRILEETERHAGELADYLKRTPEEK